MPGKRNQAEDQEQGREDMVLRICPVCRQHVMIPAETDPGEGWQHASLVDCVQYLVSRLNRLEGRLRQR